MHHSERRARELIKRLDPHISRGAEIGVWKGEMSRHLLRLRPYLFLIMVDQWESGRECSQSYRRSGDYLARQTRQKMQRAKREARQSTDFAASRRAIWHAASMEAAKSADNHSLDFVFIDAEHTYEAVKADIQAWLPKLRPGALLSGHDYSPPGERSEKGWPGVVQAVDEFVIQSGLTLDRGEEATWFIRLP